MKLLLLVDMHHHVLSCVNLVPNVLKGDHIGNLHTSHERIRLRFKRRSWSHCNWLWYWLNLSFMLLWNNVFFVKIQVYEVKVCWLVVLLIVAYREKVFKVLEHYLLVILNFKGQCHRFLQPVMTLRLGKIEKVCCCWLFLVLFYQNLIID